MPLHDADLGSLTIGGTMANPQQVGSFVPTTNVWDPAELYSVEVTSPRFKELLVRLYQNINLIAIVLNTKDSGIYDKIGEFVNGQVWFPNPNLNSTSQLTPTFRQVYRTVINFGTLPNAAVKSVAHGITTTVATTFTRIYGTASDTTNKIYIPLPFVETLGNNIQLDVDATNVNITTTIDYTNFNVCYIIVEYIQQ
jgi:hypothetical protein